jgi:hypothetical protein
MMRDLLERLACLTFAIWVDDEVVVLLVERVCSGWLDWIIGLVVNDDQVAGEQMMGYSRPLCRLPPMITDE